MTEATEVIATAPENVEPLPFGGWLILVLIGLVSTPLIIGYNAYTELWPIIAEGHFYRLAVPGGAAYDPTWAVLLWFQVLGRAARIGISGVALWYFVQKSKRAPLWVIIWLLSAFLYLALERNLTGRIPELAEAYRAEGMMPFVRSVIQCIIWCPYFLLSKQVERTFVR